MNLLLVIKVRFNNEGVTISAPTVTLERGNV